VTADTPGITPPLAKLHSQERFRESEWHIMARWIAAVGLGLIAAVAHMFGYVETVGHLVTISALVVLYNLAIVLSPWRRTPSRTARLGILSLDILAITAFLHYSGDIENPLVISYSLPVVAGSMIAGRRAGIFLASVAMILLSFMMFATLVDAFPVHLAHHHLSILAGVALHDRIDPDTAPENIGYLLSHGIVLGLVLYGSAIGFGTLSSRIQEASDRILLLLHILPDGAVMVDRSGKVLVSNPAADRILGEHLGSSIHMSDPEMGLAPRFAAFKGPVEEFETSWHGRVLGNALAQSSPESPLVWVFRDLTSERHLMAQVMHNSKMADLGLLAAGIAHEIGNPLSSISAIVQVLQIKNPVPELQPRFNALAANVDRIKLIVQAIGGYARPSAEHRSVQDLRKVCEQVLSIFRFHEKARETTLEVTEPADPVRVDAVPDQLIQVILNLLLNAADASNGKGMIRITIAEDGKEATLSVADRGSGVSAEVRRRLFTPFFTTKGPDKGSGLGLFVSESIVRNHGGRIEVSSSSEQGATFTIHLPLSTKET